MEHDDYLYRVQAQKIFHDSEARKVEALIEMYAKTRVLWVEREKAEEAKRVRAKKLMRNAILLSVAVVAFAVGTLVQKAWC